MTEQAKLQMEQVVKVLENKVNAASERVEKANKCYQNSLAKIEKQKASAEKARLEIDLTQKKICRQLVMLQKLKKHLEDAKNEQAQGPQKIMICGVPAELTQTYKFNVSIAEEPKSQYI